MRKIINLLLILILIAACASGADAKWYIKDVAVDKQEWRYCSLDKDGPEKSDKGFCRISQECIKKILRKEKCRPIPMFCAHGDFECLRKNKFPLIKRGN